MIVEGLQIESVGKRDWLIYRAEDGEYLGSITEFEAVEGPPFYITSIERRDAPAHATLRSAIELFAGLAA